MQQPHARLGIERVGARSVVGTAFARSPLRLLTPHNRGHAAWAFTSTLGGGLVDGDQVSLDVQVRPGATAVLSSQGANRVYRSPRGCRSSLSANVDEGGFLAVVPDPTACFAGAQFHQEIAVRLAPGASLALVDVLSAGRTARGERWAFRRYQNELTVQLGERMLLAESVLLDPAHGPIAERFGRFNVLATLLLVGETLRDPIAALRERLDALPVKPRSAYLASASPLGDSGLLVRMAAVSVEDVQSTLRAQLQFLPALLGDDPWARRV